MRVVSGVQPSGYIHLGNYFGAIRNHLALQHENEAIYFIADYHAMTTVQDPAKLQEYTLRVAADYLTLGLDPEKAIFFRQSDVPEVLELAWILSVVSGKGLLDRAHSYKDKVQRGVVPSVGLYTYPVLMAADILLYQADRVPVGQDQKQHIEMTQDMAQSFQHVYGTGVLRRPEPLLSNTPKVLGLDGEKMSKSYGNDLGVFETAAAAKKKIMSIKTSSLPVEAPKDPDSCLAMAFMRLLATSEEVKTWEDRYRAGGVGYGAVKTRLVELYEEQFGRLRETHAGWLSDRNRIEQVLTAGSQKARLIAVDTLKKIRAAVGLSR